MNIFKDNFDDTNKHMDLFIPLMCEGAQNHLMFAKQKTQKKALRKTLRNINKEFTSKDKNSKQLKLSIVKVLLQLEQCPSTILNTDGDIWLQFCIRNLSNTCVPMVKCSLGIISFIFKASVKYEGLRKKLAEYDKNLIKKLCLFHSSVREHSFRCLYEILSLYPSRGFPQRKIIEKNLMKVLTTPLDSNNDLVYAAASVFSVLPLPGGDIAASEMRGQQLEQLISLGHYAADAAFYDITENEEYKFTRKHKLPTETIEVEMELNDNSSRMLTASLVLANCFEFIKVFLERCTTQFVSIKPMVLMNLCFRILRVEALSLKEKNSAEVRNLVFILPSLHSRAIRLLKYLIQNNFCAFYINLVEDQLVSILKSTNETSSLFGLEKEEDKSNQSTVLKTFLSVRIRCYEALMEVAKISKGLNGSIIEGLIFNLLADIKPIKDIISLNQATIGGRLSLVNAKKKSKKKGYTVTFNHCQAALSHVPLSAVVSQRIPLTVSALKLIEVIFTYAHHTLHLKYIKQLQDELMTLLKTQRIGIYGDARVRESLFSAIVANFQHPHPLCPPQFNYLQRAFQDEAQYYREQVSATVERGLSTLSSICSNHNTIKLSDIVNINEESKEVKTKIVPEEPALNGDVDMHESENDESLEDDDDDYSVEEDEQLSLSLDEDNDDDTLEDYEIKSEDKNDTTYAEDVKESDNNNNNEKENGHLKKEDEDHFGLDSGERNQYDEELIDINTNSDNENSHDTFELNVSNVDIIAEENEVCEEHDEKEIEDGNDVEEIDHSDIDAEDIDEDVDVEDIEDVDVEEIEDGNVDVEEIDDGYAHVEEIDEGDADVEKIEDYGETVGDGDNDDEVEEVEEDHINERKRGSDSVESPLTKRNKMENEDNDSDISTEEILTMLVEEDSSSDNDAG